MCTHYTPSHIVSRSTCDALPLMAALQPQPGVEQLYWSLPLPTNSRSIRVLRFESVSSHDVNSAALQADFHIIDLATTPAPDFTALSYVWGEVESATLTSSITLGPNRVALQVTDNCHRALSALRSLPRSLTIWVDAICINQNDISEKTHQLSLKEEIYKKADTTYVWLGSGDEASTRAIHCLSTVGILEYFFSTPQQFPGALIKPRPLTAALALYLRRWRHLKHGLKLGLDYDGLECKNFSCNDAAHLSRYNH